MQELLAKYQSDLAFKAALDAADSAAAAVQVAAQYGLTASLSELQSPSRQRRLFQPVLA